MTNKKEKRLTVDLPIDVFNGLKAISMAKNMTMKEWLSEELRKKFSVLRPRVLWRESQNHTRNEKE
jgi:hypothetical protein